ncbi:MAG: YybS family protein [Candidatus Goldbacteria bacterium]|nr:YybS family protein [Candidatus Goldiibacteriota bacterium]
MHNTIIFFFVSLLLMFFFFAFMSLIFFYFLKKNTKWIITIFIGFFYFNAVLAGLFFVIKSKSEHNVIEFVYSELYRNLDEILILEEKSGAPKERIIFIKNLFENFIIKTVPSWIICVEFFLIFLNYFVVRIYLMKKYDIDDGMKPFTIWKIDERVIWFLICCLSVFVLDRFFHNDMIFTISLNGTFLLMNLYFVAGLSIVTFFLVKYSVPIFIQFFIYVLILMWSGLSMIIILTGILDTWFNFRKLEKSRDGLLWK